jgi:hypothetical protein
MINLMHLVLITVLVTIAFTLALIIAQVIILIGLYNFRKQLARLYMKVLFEFINDPEIRSEYENDFNTMIESISK